MSADNYDNIFKEIGILQNEQRIILFRLRRYEEDINTIDKKIEDLMKKFPSCYSCGRYRHPKNMIIATQEDVDDYYDKNDGYNGPEVGKYYCGC